MFNILVVDDQENIRKLMTTYLRRDGYKVYNAADGLEALEILDSDHIDLMIVDVMMPNMDGYTLTNELRTSKYSFPILMITAKNTFEDKKKGFLSGTDDYMVKPIDFNEMLLRVSALLRRAKISNEHKIVIYNTEGRFLCVIKIRIDRNETLGGGINIEFERKVYKNQR